MSYRNTCSCCGDHIDKEQMDFLVETKQVDLEGNHCSQCYYDIDRDNYDKIQKLIIDIDNALSTPIKKFKWRYKPLEEKVAFIFSCMDKGIITWQIGGR